MARSYMSSRHAIGLDMFTVLFKDGITMCVVSGWTGRIALGSRVGDIVLFISETSRRS